jgi:hypothetical protein
MVILTITFNQINISQLYTLGENHNYINNDVKIIVLYVNLYVFLNH